MVIIMATSPTAISFHSGATTNGNGSAYNVTTEERCLIQVSGLSAGDATVSFECSVDGTNYTPLVGVDVADPSSQVSSVTADGVWLVHCGLMLKLRCPISDYVSGTINVEGSTE